MALSQWALFLGLLAGGCVAVPSASAPDRQAVYGYDGHCIIADSQDRAIYTTTAASPSVYMTNVWRRPTACSSLSGRADPDGACMRVYLLQRIWGHSSSASPRRLRLSTLGVSTYPYWASAPMHSGDASMYPPGGSHTFLGGERPCNHPVPIVIRQV